MNDGLKSFILNRFSGGEQDLACLALRLGLSRLISGNLMPEFVILDEIFAGQDLQRRRGLVYALGRLCPPLRQIFIVTHVEQIQEFLPSLRITEGKDGFAKIENR